jgi:hypothetical protein
MTKHRVLNLFLCVQVLPLVPPGRMANEDGSPYSGQVTLFIQTCYLFSFHFFFTLVGGGGVEKFEYANVY